jgi:hypothetical protein
MSHVVISVECSNCVEILLNEASEMDMRVGLDRVTVQEMSYGASFKQTPRLRSLLYHSTNMARGVMCSTNADHAGFVVDSVALGQVSLSLSVSLHCGARTVKGK